MKWKKIWKDPSFWVLLGVNGYLVYYYFRQPSIFPTLLWLYWAQSMLMGAFNVLDILTVRRVDTNEQFQQNGKTVTTSFTKRVPSALFFLFHFGMFHLVYFFFLSHMAATKDIDWAFLRYFLYAFMGGQIIGFVQHKIQQWSVVTSLSKLFIAPYARIIPMHLTIILSGFFAGAAMGIFLVLKSIADVVGYVATKQSPAKARESNAATVAAQQQINL